MNNTSVQILGLCIVLNFRCFTENYRAHYEKHHIIVSLYMWELPLMLDEDKNFGRFLVLNFAKR